MSDFKQRLSQNPQLKAEVVEFFKARRVAALERLGHAQTAEQVFRAQGALAETEMTISELER